MDPILYVGNKNYSSWSLRAWLCLKWADIPFEERYINLGQTGYGDQKIRELKAVSPSGTVPALKLPTYTVWGSLAIAEWAAERRPGALWPKDERARSLARSAAAEMHSGFGPVRRDLPMNIHRRCAEQDWKPETRAGIDRIVELWTDLRSQWKNLGPWLVGTRSAADAFFIPVATRFRTYSVELPPLAARYVETALSDPDFKVWESQSEPNSWDRYGVSVIDGLYA